MNTFINKNLNFPIHLRFFLIWLLLVSCLLIANPDVYGTDLIPVSEKQLIEKAELIFDGIVTKIEYKDSSPLGKDDHPIPHTFVTFKIQKIYKGAFPKSEYITLRFTGGPYKNGRILIIPGVPLFDIGERSILFVNGNTKKICPLVGWDQGRFRIINNMIYSDEGSEVLLSLQKNLTLGDYQPLDEIIFNNIAGKKLTKIHSDSKSENSIQLKSVVGERLTYERFNIFINELVTKYIRKEEIKNPKIVFTANVKEEFNFKLNLMGPPKLKF